jgi:hypothetical protein
MSTHALAPCEPSPIPGKRPFDSDCALLVQKQFAVLPAGDLVLRIENFATIDKAQSAATPASAVVEAAGKVWLLTLSAKGQRSHSGQFVTEVGPIPPIPYAANYVMDVAEADLGPANKEAVARAIHIHPGPEIFYLLTGEQCLETPNGVSKARAGEGMTAPANTPMQLNIMGQSKRDAFFIVIHDASKPRANVSDWQPRGLCRE